MKNSGAKRLIIKFRAQIKSKKKMKNREMSKKDKDNKETMNNFNLIVKNVKS